MMLGFEDDWISEQAHESGDQDFNDVVFVLKGLTYTPSPASGSVSTPEPGTLVGTLFAFGVMGLTSVQKRQGKKS
ncbi:MAG: PEP-CTERM sorting domain-containing protein [Moorea sp. SIO1G6]|nr:PEP-CTERM sorting domain-containing protein [Moorena sp. SIO1G6]